MATDKKPKSFEEWKLAKDKEEKKRRKKEKKSKAGNSGAVEVLACAMCCMLILPVLAAALYIHLTGWQYKSDKAWTPTPPPDENTMDGHAVQLDDKNFPHVVFDSNKTALVFFFAPWCGHCKQFKPTFQELAQKHKASKHTNLATLDCTAWEAICGMYQIQGYPTLMYADGTGMTLQKYEGSRDFLSLDRFIREELGPKCSNDSREHCRSDEIAILDKYLKMSGSERKAIVDKAAADVSAVEVKFKIAVEEIQSEYERVTNTHKEVVAKYSTEEMRLLRTIPAE